MEKNFDISFRVLDRKWGGGGQSFLDDCCRFCVSTGKFLCYVGIWKHETEEFGGMVTGLERDIMFSHKLCPQSL